MPFVLQLKAKMPKPVAVEEESGIFNAKSFLERAQYTSPHTKEDLKIARLVQSWTIYCGHEHDLIHLLPSPLQRVTWSRQGRRGQRAEEQPPQDCRQYVHVGLSTCILVARARRSKCRLHHAPPPGSKG